MTWNESSAGGAWTAPGAEGAGSHAGVAVEGDLSETGIRGIDLTQFVQEWSDGAPNYGVVFTNVGNDGADFDSSESLDTPPVLTVWYSGTWEEVETMALTGTDDAVTFTRSLEDGEQYVWNCLVRNTSGEEAWGPREYFFDVRSGPAGANFYRGEINQDGSVNIADAVALLGYLFSGAAAPGCEDAADANDDGGVNVADAIALLGHLFSGTGELPAPSALTCGPDPTADDIPTCVFPICP